MLPRAQQDHPSRSPPLEGQCLARGSRASRRPAASGCRWAASMATSACAASKGAARHYKTAPWARRVGRGGARAVIRSDLVHPAARSCRPASSRSVLHIFGGDRSFRSLEIVFVVASGHGAKKMRVRSFIFILHAGDDRPGPSGSRWSPPSSSSRSKSQKNRSRLRAADAHARHVPTGRFCSAPHGGGG